MLILRIVLRPQGDPSRERLLEEVQLTNLVEEPGPNGEELYAIEHGPTYGRQTDHARFPVKGYLRTVLEAVRFLYRKRGGEPV